jgi:asparagine synthase (glutamine-hydrolysing)|tara:strand:- start:452 stop:2128 length:1677 start_codon:yes stop_codon:yes gene_type:complete
MRGPDLTTYEVLWEGRIFIGQAVLSITGDLKSYSQDNMKSVSGRYHLSYNGEIYNYKELNSKWLNERTKISEDKSDMEILVNLHEVLPEEKIPILLEGMYAYTLLDSEKHTLSICRDVQGEKSLYIYEDQQLVIIASEIGAIRTIFPRVKIEPQVFRDYFRTRHFMTFENTPYSGIRKLGPGRHETFNLSSMKWSITHSYELHDLIEPEKIKQNENRSIASLVDELDSLMIDCVKQMIPTNRKYAAVVSGGVDSSLIAYYLVKYGDPEMLVAVNNIGKDRISKDLSGFEKALGRTINVIDIDQAAYSREIERCQKACNSPLYTHSLIGQAVQSALVRSSGCRVLFGGDGADELFGGYDCYLGKHRSSSKFSPSPYATCAEPKIDFLVDDSSSIQSYLSKAWKRSLNAYCDVDNQITQAMLYCDAAYQLPSVCLHGADLMSMIWSVEARSLFVRKAIISFALNLPASFKVYNDSGIPSLLQSKFIIKKLFLRYFPEGLLVEKQGFAGFPNESGAYLGNLEDYLALDFLGIPKEKINESLLDRATMWKLINVEYFLRWIS